MDDRRVHARYTDMEIVRYDRAGKWYLEPTIPGLKRQHVTISDAARAARWGIANADGSHTPGIPGGGAFDRLVEISEEEAVARSLGRPGKGMNAPSYNELWDRILQADDTACDGGWQDSDCPWCRRVVEILRGGNIMCPECRHINAIGHSCSDWREYDAGQITLEEVTRRSRQRDEARRSEP